MVIVFYISGHGFGHVTRDLEIIRHIQLARPEARIVVRTSVPRWFLERSATQPIEIQPCQTDTGITQIDSLQIDLTSTVDQASSFYGTFDERVRAEALVLTDLGASVVVGDVPPLAFAAAQRARIPSIAVANFTWDWIYAEYSLFHTAAPQVLTTIRSAYSAATLALRLPFAGGFETMRQIRDVPLVARRSRRTRKENRHLLDLGGDRPVVLASFGGHGATLPLEQVANTEDLTLLVTDHEAASLPEAATRNGKLRGFTGRMLEHAQIRYEDLVAAADFVVSKPCYGIVAECIANGTALLHTSRGEFAENDVLVAGMRPVLRTRFISQDDLRAARWGASVQAILAEPEPTARMRIDGASVVASAILDVAE